LVTPESVEILRVNNGDETQEVSFAPDHNHGFMDFI
jgi:hypothetical protein